MASFWPQHLEQLLHLVHTCLRRLLKQLLEGLIMPGEQPTLSLQGAVLELPAQQSQGREAVSQ